MLIRDPELVGDYKACGFGKWYYSEEGERFRRFSIFSEFEEVHKKIHLLCKEIVIAYNSGDKERVKTLIAERDANIEKMISLFEKMKEIYLKE